MGIKPYSYWMTLNSVSLQFLVHRQNSILKTFWRTAHAKHNQHTAPPGLKLSEMVVAEWSGNRWVAAVPVAESPPMIIAWSRSAEGRSKRRIRSKVSKMYSLSTWSLKPWMTFSNISKQFLISVPLVVSYKHDKYWSINNRLTIKAIISIWIHGPEWFLSWHLYQPLSCWIIRQYFSFIWR